MDDPISPWEDVIAQQDKYRNYKELSDREREGVAYCIVVRSVAGSLTAIIAPHGGSIEFLTAELADSIAGETHNFYAFLGTKSTNNRDLHITSSRFDEPRALALVGLCEKVLAVHGLGQDSQSVQIGGRDGALRDRVHTALRAVGFDSRIVIDGDFGGTNSHNICNRGSTRVGVQLEIDAGLRQTLKADRAAYGKFVDAIRSTL